jgi:hypothetical protein
MPSDLPQRRALIFLREHLQTQMPFTRAQFSEVTGWTGATLTTYWSKQFKRFFVPVPPNQFRVSEAFRPFLTWKKFQHHVTQHRRIAADYHRLEHEIVVIYEFFMPLTNETALRTTLDALFYRDNVIPKLRAIPELEIVAHMPLNQGETIEQHLDRVATWIGDHFGGYSIYHVNGRFKAGSLLTREQAAAREIQGFRYLVDETTAVTRFIFPCTDQAEAGLVRYFFDAVFVRSIIQLVNAEDEIWMVESGLRNRVHIWRVDDDGDEGEIDEDAEEEDDQNEAEEED